MHAMTYGTYDVLRPQSGLSGPDMDDYIHALLIGASVNVVVASGMVWFLSTTRVGGWPPVLVAGIAASTGAAVACGASLVTLGISPVTFLTAL